MGNEYILNRATMLTSRKVTGLVIKEMTACHKNKAFSEVNCEDFIDFINNCHRQTLSKNICRIIYKMELDDSRTNLFNTWLLRKTPLLSVVFPEYNEVQYRERKSVYEYPQFNLMTADWPIGFDNIFQPSTQAIKEIVIIISIVTDAASSKRNRHGNPNLQSCTPLCPETRNVQQRNMSNEVKCYSPPVMRQRTRRERYSPPVLRSRRKYN